MSECSDKESLVVGDGVCGVNGNTKVFMADQSATTCSENEEVKGDIYGLYEGILPTTTELVGKTNALLYQVFFPGYMFGEGQEDRLYQSQLTTITRSLSGQVHRTRTAQSFDVQSTFTSEAVSYYREKRVNKTEFYAQFEEAISEYNINENDLCKWDSNGGAIADKTGSLEACKDHLEQSFALGKEHE